MSLSEIEIEARGPRGPLRGTLTRCGREGAPLALIHPGSGPTDRDGNNPLGVAGAPYRLLARALAERGIDAARLDKRGLYGSCAAGDPNAVTLESYADDLSAWLDALAPGRAGKIALIGHSEGGLVALTAARDPRVEALVLLTTPGLPLVELTASQLAANPYNASLLPAAFAALDRLAAGLRVEPETLAPGLAALFPAPVQGFWIDLLARDPAPMFAATRQPALIVQGGRDLQIGAENADALARARPDAERVDFALMTHVLKDVAEESRLANLATYARPDLPLTPGLADAIADFLARAL